MTGVTFEKVCQVQGIPVPVAEFRFAPPRRWRFDYAWPAFKVALEVEGGVWTRGRHTRGQGFVNDLEKYREAACLGWLVLRTVPDELYLMAPYLRRAFSARPLSEDPSHA